MIFQQYVVVLICMCLAIRAHSQQSKSQMPDKESNAILVSFDKDEEEAFKIAGRALMTAGYKIKSSDKNFLTIATERESRSGWSFKFTLYVAVLDGNVIIRGLAVSGDSEFDPYYGRGRTGTVPVAAFGLMLEYAKLLRTSFQNSTVSYAQY